MGKRGPRAKPHIAREANGRASRKPVDVTKQLNGALQADERETLRIGVEARHRMYGSTANRPSGLKPEQLRDTDAGTFVGRLRLSGEITAQQCEAAIRFGEVHHAMQLALGGPKSSGAVNLNATHGMPGAENVQRSIQALADWRSALAAIQAKQNAIKGTGALYAALELCIIRDAECPHLIEWLRIGLDTLAGHFRIGDKFASSRKAA